MAIWRKRSFPKIARIHKKKEDTDTHRYFITEVMLFHGFTDEHDLGCDNEDRCRKKDEERRRKTQYNTLKIMGKI